LAFFPSSCRKCNGPHGTRHRLSLPRIASQIRHSLARHLASHRVVTSHHFTQFSLAHTYAYVPRVVVAPAACVSNIQQIVLSSPRRYYPRSTLGINIARPLHHLTILCSEAISPAVYFNVVSSVTTHTCYSRFQRFGTCERRCEYQATKKETKHTHSQKTHVRMHARTHTSVHAHTRAYARAYAHIHTHTHTNTTQTQTRTQHTTHNTQHTTHNTQHTTHNTQHTNTQTHNTQTKTQQ
jgi:hypothetical protein